LKEAGVKVVDEFMDIPKAVKEILGK